jgi:hypothetical protein
VLPVRTRHHPSTFTPNLANKFAQAVFNYVLSITVILTSRTPAVIMTFVETRNRNINSIGHLSGQLGLSGGKGLIDPIRYS